MPSLARLSTLVSGRRSKWAIIAAWLMLAAALSPLLPELEQEAADESDTFLVRGSESAELNRVVDDRFERGSEMAAVIVFHHEGGITAEDRARIDGYAYEICGSAQVPSLVLVGTPYNLVCGEQDPADLSPGRALLQSPDGEVVLATALMTDESTPVAEQAVATIREIVPPPDADGLRAWVTGEAGFEADRSEAVKGIDETLLIVTVAVLLALLLAIYRSPLVAAVPLFVVGVAYVVAAGIAYGLVAAGITEISGQTTAILIVLMFGAGTDYCLLIVARFRDELRRRDEVHAAMARAAERTGPAILSAGAIVIAAMLVLAVADFNATREMGPILALGVAVMVLCGLTLLPALLAALGRRAFWPSIPRTGTGEAPAGFWRRVADAVRARPRAIAAGVAAALVLGSLGNLGGREQLDFSEAFRDPPDSVVGQEVIQEHFGLGRAAPLRIVAEQGASEQVLAALTEGADSPVREAYATAASSPPGAQADERVLILADAYLAFDPFSERATDAVPEIRRRARDAAGGPEVLIGGEVAETYDTKEAIARDTRIIVPLGLLLVFAILVVLLRAVVMPLYVIATVILSFGFALGTGSLIFTGLMDQPGSDPSLALFAFIFLVALGVDYNVFLLARIREERAKRPTPEAAGEALARTGGVITSAGLVLAATFATLMALELESLFQVGFVVGLGLLADTFLVRALLVPALAVTLGERNWWPWRS